MVAQVEPHITMDEAKQWLSELGVPSIDVEGVLAEFPVVELPPEVKVLSEEDTTPALVLAMNSVQGIIPSFPFMPPCLFGFEPWCWLRQPLVPKILIRLAPLKLVNVTIHVLSTKIRGDVVTRFYNDSTEGGKEEVNQKTRETRNRQPVSGSADLSGNFLHKLHLPDLQDWNLASFTSVFSSIRPDSLLDFTGTFEKSGTLNLIKSLTSLILQGAIQTSSGIDIAMNYQFNGTQVIEKHLALSLKLPVEGKVQYKLF